MDALILPIASLLLAFLIMVIFFGQKRANIEETKIYSRLLVVNFIDALLAILTYIFAKSTNWEFGIIFLQKIYMSLIILMIVYINCYNISIMKLKKKLKKAITTFLLLSFYIIFIFIMFTPLSVINEGFILDGYGLSYNITLYSTIFYLILIVISSSIIFIKNKDCIKKDIPFLCLIILYILGLIARKFFPSVMFENFFFSYMLFIMYFTIENPDIKMIEKLNIAVSNAEKASRAKSDFLSSMSHEIRTPLNAIVGLSLDLEQQKNCPKEIKEDLKDIVYASNTLLEVVGNIMDINKIETDEMKIHSKEYSIRKEVTAIVKLNHSRLEKKSVKLIVELNDTVPELLIGDANHIKEILNNLLSNAIKYTEQGEIYLSITGERKANQYKLIITCKDTGRGIKEENLKKLFHKFERLDVEKNTNIEGTGLGLAITKKLVDLMKGKILVESIVGQGSTFTVILPQKIPRSLLENKNTSLALTKKEQNIPLNQIFQKVLIVDDNALNRKVARRILESIQITNIEECCNGRECLEKVAMENYDVILMDIMMPIMNGEEALIALKKKQNFKTPVIALSADALTGAEDRYQKEGFHAYLAKPFTKEQLKDKLEALSKIK